MTILCDIVRHQRRTQREPLSFDAVVLVCVLAVFFAACLGGLALFGVAAGRL